MAPALKPDYIIDHNGLPNILNSRSHVTKIPIIQSHQLSKSAKDRMNQQIAAASKDRTAQQQLSNHCTNNIAKKCDKKLNRSSCGGGNKHIESSSNAAKRYIHVADESCRPYY